MADWVTISSLATAGGTMILAVATFASVRTSNRAARVAEQSLLVGLRPVLVPSRPEDPPEHVTFVDRGFTVNGGTAHVEEAEGSYYMAIPLRNVGSGLAVLHGWHVTPRRVSAVDDRPDPDGFRRLLRDLYVAPGDTGYWQGAIRAEDDPMRPAIAQSLSERSAIVVDVLYGDHEGGQRTISRFGLLPGEDGQWDCNVLRHWRLDGLDPRSD